MLVNVIDNLVRNVVTDALSTLTEKADLGGRDIVLDELRNYTNIVFPLLQADEGVIYAILASRTL